MTRYSPTIGVMVQAARKAGRRLARDFGEVENLQVSKKGPADFVSAADLMAEQILVEELTHARPGYGVLAEERGNVPGTDKTHRWIIDPLDGTTNFLHGLPHFAISIGLERENELVAGVVLDPIKDELFWAEKGQGAWVNSRRLRVSGRTDLSTALLATGVPFMGRPGLETFMREMAHLTARSSGIRRYGSAALDLAYVAAGRYEAFWETGLSAWDVAAGIVLVREAGGMISAIDGSKFKLESPSILVANQELFTPIGDLLRQAQKGQSEGA